MIYSFIPLVLILGALGRRIAGGVLNTWAGYDGTANRVMGDTPARLIYGALVALAALLGGAVWWLALLMIPAVWVGTTTGNDDSRDMGFGITSFWHDFWGMTEHATLSLTPAIVVGIYNVAHMTRLFADNYIIGGTLLAAPLYWLGWVIAIALGGQIIPPDNSGSVGNGRLFAGLQGGSEWGEALWGASCALGTFLAFAT